MIMHNSGHGGVGDDVNGDSQGLNKRKFEGGDHLENLWKQILQVQCIRLAQLW